MIISTLNNVQDVVMTTVDHNEKDLGKTIQVSLLIRFYLVVVVGSDRISYKSIFFFMNVF
jgi:hypothetical protein